MCIRDRDRGLHKQKIRPYFLGLKYDGYHVLLPLRSNCPKRYSVAIDHPDPTKENHGIDCTTMLLLRNRELNTMAKEIQLHPYEVAENVKNKYSRIHAMAMYTISQYKACLLYTSVQCMQVHWNLQEIQMVMKVTMLVMCR